MANRIDDLPAFYDAVAQDVRHNYKGAVNMFGFSKALEMVLGERIVQLKTDKINEQEYINKVNLFCKKCGGNMKPSKAIKNTYTSPDGGKPKVGECVRPGGKGKLIDCQKCEDCGWCAYN